MRLSSSLVCVMFLVSMKRSRNRSELERHSISAEQLESLMASGKGPCEIVAAAGRLVVKECIMLGAAILTMAHAAETYVNHQ